MNLYDGNGKVVNISGGGSGSAENLTDAQISDSANIELSKLANMEKTMSVGTIRIQTDFEWTEGIWLNTSDGKEVANSAWASTEKIYLTSADTITVEYFKANQNFGFHAYAEDGTWLGRAVDEGTHAVGDITTIAPPENTAYIRLCTNKTYAGSEEVCSATYQTPFENYDFIDSRTRKVKELEIRKKNNARFNALDALLWNYTKWNGKTIVADGNSLVASTNWIAHMCEFLGATAVNVGVSGSSITKPDQPSASATIEEKRQYIMDRVANKYPDKADLILLQESSWLDGEPSDQMDGDSQSTSWMARMNYFIRCLKAKYPNALIVLMPDNPWYNGSSASNGNDADALVNVNDQYLTDRNRNAYEALKKLAEYNRLAFWCIDNSTPFNPLYLDNYYSRYYNMVAEYPNITQDGVHPVNYGRAKGHAMAHWAAGLVFNPNAPNDAIADWQTKLVKYEATTE